MEWSKFWPLWLQKNLRNLSSMKYQWLILLYLPVIFGIFEGRWVEDVWVSLIPVEVGLGFLFGSFLTVFSIRIYAKTKLTEDSDGFYEGEEGME